MKTRTRGKRFVMLLYQRTMDRTWQASLPLGLALIGLWYFSYLIMPGLSEYADAVIFIGSLVALAIAAFALLSRNSAYVQAYSDHLRVITPFLRLKISYRRVAGVRPTQFQALFSPQKASATERSYLEPFWGATVVVADLSDYPFNPRTIRWFLPRQMFSPEKKGLVFLVKDWMSLSEELESFLLAWRQSQVRKETRPPSGYGILGNIDKDRY